MFQGYTGGTLFAQPRRQGGNLRSRSQYIGELFLSFSMLLDMTFRIQGPACQCAIQCACEALDQSDDASCNPLSDTPTLQLVSAAFFRGLGARYVPSCHMVGAYFLGQKCVLDELLPPFMLLASQQARCVVFLWGALQHALGCPRSNRMSHSE